MNNLLTKHSNGELSFAVGIQKLVDSAFIPIVIFISFYLSLSSFPLFDLDEGAFSSATLEMLQRHDFITTYMGGELRFDKPILIYWLQALSVSTFGLNEFALRLPSTLCATAWALATYFFVRDYLSRSKAITAVVFMASSFIFSIIARAATADALLNACICLALLDGYRFFNLYKNQPTGFTVVSSLTQPTVLRAYAWVGLGVLAKGPIAIFIPLATLALYAVITKEKATLAKLIFNPIGWVLCLALFLPWYILEYIDQGQAFIDGFFIKHNLSRFSNTMEGHGGNPWYYMPISLLIFLPASGIFILLLKQWQRPQQFDHLDIFCWIWFLLVFVLFSLSKTQLPHYLLYGATPIFILMAKHREMLTKNLWTMIPAFLFFTLMIGLPWLLTRTLTHTNNAYIAHMIQNGFHYFDQRYFVVNSLALILILFIGTKKSYKPWEKHQLINAVFSLAITLSIIPTLANIQQTPVVECAKFAKSIHEPIVIYQHDKQSFSVYLNAIVPIGTPQINQVMFTRIDRLSHFKDTTVLFERGGNVLARVNQ